MKFPVLRRGSLATRLTLMLAAIVLAAFAACGFALDWTMRRDLIREERADLRATADRVQRVVAEASRLGDDGAVRKALNDLLTARSDLHLWVTSGGGRALYASSAPPKPVDREGAWSTIEGDRGTSLAALHFALGATEPWRSAEGVVAVDTAVRHRMIASHGIALLLIYVAGITFTLVAGTMATKRGLRPLATLAREAEEMSPKDLGRRLTVAALHDEVEIIAGSFNQTLDRLEAAYVQMEGFNADVAHELRTPLATLIQGTHLALARPRRVDELRDVLASNLEELDRMNALVGDMLFLARADKGDGVLEARPTSLAEEAGKVVDFFDAACEERRVTVEIVGDARVRCVASLVRRALSNLVSNALRHSSPDSAVRIRIEVSGPLALLSVENTGETIAPEAIARIFDRFYVADAARATNGEAHGLGLAIVRAIGRMHGGDVFASSRDRLTSIGLSLPVG